MECKKASVSVFVCLYYKICRDSFIVRVRVCGRRQSREGGGGGRGDMLLCCVFRE